MKLIKSEGLTCQLRFYLSPIPDLFNEVHNTRMSPFVFNGHDISHSARSTFSAGISRDHPFFADIFIAFPKAGKSSFSSLCIVISSHVILQFTLERLNDTNMYAMLFFISSCNNRPMCLTNKLHVLKLREMLNFICYSIIRSLYFYDNDKFNRRPKK